MFKRKKTPETLCFWGFSVILRIKLSFVLWKNNVKIFYLNDRNYIIDETENLLSGAKPTPF